jgi:hypothetical protein
MDQPTPDLPTPDAPTPDTSAAAKVPTVPVVESPPGPIANPDLVTHRSGQPTPTDVRAGDERAEGPEEPRADRIGARLQRLVGDERVLAWTQGWVSREVRPHRLLAARTLDFAVVTERSLSLFSTGFFTRRPRRRVYNSRFGRIFVTADVVARGRRRVRITSRNARPLWFELDASDRAVAFVAELTARAKSFQP